MLGAVFSGLFGLGRFQDFIVLIQDMRKGFIVALICGASVFFSELTHGQQIIVNKQLDQVHLSRSTARAIFSMRQTHWPDGRLIHVFVLDDRAPLHKTFSKKILGVFPYQLRKIWDRRLYSGTGRAPVRVGSVEEMHQRVAGTPGAIGYINDGDDVSDVNVLITQ
jgi:hypothetical protein